MRASELPELCTIRLQFKGSRWSPPVAATAILPTRSVFRRHRASRQRSQHKQWVAVVVAAATVVSGCAWQRIPAAPSYTMPSPLPIRVGIVLGDTQASAFYGPGVVGLWKDMRVFETVTYPYQEGNAVDGVLRLTINGDWKGSGAGAGFVVGLTLGLASPVVGPSTTGVHDALLPYRGIARRWHDTLCTSNRR